MNGCGRFLVRKYKTFSKIQQLHTMILVQFIVSRNVCVFVQTYKVKKTTLKGKEAAMSDQHKAVNPNMVILGRESRGLSQKDLSDRLSITQGRISKIEMRF